MASKKNRVANGRTNALADALEAGKPIANMTGYIEMGDTDRNSRDSVFVKVKAVRISTEDCGMKVLVKPFSGQGELAITPCRWFNTPADIKAAKEIKNRLDAARSDFASIYSRPHYAKQRRANLKAYAEANLSSEQLEAFEQEIREVCNQQDDAAPAYNRLGDADVRKLSKSVVLTIHDFAADEVTL